MNSSSSPFPGPAAIATLIDTVITVEQDVLVVKYVTVASLAQLLYDIMLTFPLEYEFIWKSKFTRGVFLYLLIRYGNLVQMAINLPYYLWVNPPFEYCRIYFYLDAWCSVACVIPITVVLAFRTYAICDRGPKYKWTLTALVTSTNLALIACLIVTCMQTQFTSPALPGFACVYSAAGVSRAAGIIQYCSAVLFGLVILVITVQRTYYYFYATGKSRLMSVILRDTLGCFCITFGESLTALLLYLCIPTKHAALAAVITNQSRTMSVILTSRIILNIRQGSNAQSLTTELLSSSPSTWQSPGPARGIGERAKNREATEATFVGQCNPVESQGLVFLSHARSDDIEMS